MHCTVTCGDITYSGGNGRHVNQWLNGETKIFHLPKFQKGFITFIKPTDGGLMVVVSVGSIYYMNHSGEFYHLFTAEPPCKGALLTSAEPPVLSWTLPNNQVVQTNTDKL